MFKNKETVIVGGAAMFHHGLVDSYNDIDIVVNSLEDIKGITYFDSKSPLSKSGKRAYIDNVDIFIEEELPEYEIIDGLKIQTINSMIKYYEDVIERSDEYTKQFAIKKLNILKPH